MRLLLILLLLVGSADAAIVIGTGGAAAAPDCCTATPDAANDADILCEDWEGSELATWTTSPTDYEQNCTSDTVDKGATHANTLACTNKGSQALEFTYETATSGATANCYTRTSFSANQAESTFDFWVNVREAGTMTTGEKSYFAFIQDSSYALSIWVSANWSTDDDHYKFQVHYHNGTSTTSMTASAELAEDGWHNITIVADTTTDTISYYVDRGSAVDTDTAYATTRIPRRLAFGNIGSSFASKANANFQIDNVRVDSSIVALPEVCPE